MTFVDNDDVKKVGMPIRGIKFSAPHHSTNPATYIKKFQKFRRIEMRVDFFMRISKF